MIYEDRQEMEHEERKAHAAEYELPYGVNDFDQVLAYANESEKKVLLRKFVLATQLRDGKQVYKVKNFKSTKSSKHQFTDAQRRRETEKEIQVSLK